ncbi:hypothetical protein DSO57_1020181 [Entomophthora muscae]|uniref:Uncharacterized protein n=1 Tax=Entomophthora muscae TaxID=34485 RepID=A0ACC2RV37_9FUNG|nr:hypothetical protein DSO57_1020181 [Entomophthora muscae]
MVSRKLFKAIQGSTRPYTLSALRKTYPRLETLGDCLLKDKRVTDHIAVTSVSGADCSELGQDFIVIPDFITELEHDDLVKASEKKLKRLATYDSDHIDNVIHNYRECQVSDWFPHEIAVNPIIDRVKALFSRDITFLPTHVLDLNDDGIIKPHVDNLELSGSVIAGLCLVSDSVIKFQPLKEQDGLKFEVLAPKNCLYIQRNSVRYNFTHAIPNDPHLRTFAGRRLENSRRISLIFRDLKPIFP